MSKPVEGKANKYWWILFGLSVVLFLWGIGCIAYTIGTGVGVWGLNNTVGWAWDITNFVWWVGIGHAGTLISAVLLLFRQNWRLSINRTYCGHGIGTVFHEAPNILHHGNKNTGMELRPGMTFTIEPMINAGKFDTKVLNDGWTAVTKDKSLSAQFEHTIGITENGYEIFTESAKGYSKPPYN